jgi:hypothetical protein
MPSRGLFLQRKCACGADASGLTGECAECSEKKMGLQTKLRVNEPDDAYEQEADRISDQVLAQPAPTEIGSAPPRIQRLSQESSGQMVAAPTSVEHALADPGKPLEPPLRQEMERRFAHDFSQVRVHSGPAADQSTRDVSANAYTVGHDIAFAAGRYAPATHAGRRLVAHELAHVVQQSGTNATSTAGPLIQRQPEKTKPETAPKPAPAAPSPAPATPKPAPATAPPKAGLNRTLHVVQNDVWTKLPAAVRASAEQELNGLFAFVGASSTEKPFSINIVDPAKLAEQFDFSESVVSVIHGDAAKYVKGAFARQDAQIRRFLAAQNVQVPAAPAAGNDPLDPEKIGFGGGSRTVRTDQGRTFALPVMAGAVNIDEVIDSFLENLDSLLQDQMAALPSKGKDPTKWPATVKKGSSSWQPLVMLGQALGRAIAHEARHEYLGSGHAESGLGEDAPYLTGEKTTAQFSKDDQKAILERIRKLEATQGTATVVPTFPQSMRQKPEDFPF